MKRLTPLERLPSCVSRLLSFSLFLFLAILSEHHQHVTQVQNIKDVNITAECCAVGDQASFSIQKPSTSPRFVLSVTCLE